MRKQKCLEGWTTKRPHWAQSWGLQMEAGVVLCMLSGRWQNMNASFSSALSIFISTENWKVGVLKLERNTWTFWTFTYDTFFFIALTPFPNQVRRWWNTSIHSLGLRFNYFFFFANFCIKVKKKGFGFSYFIWYLILNPKWSGREKIRV